MVQRQAIDRRAALCAALLLLAVLSFVRSDAHAGMVGVSPLRVYFDADEQSAVVRIQNTGDDKIAMQVEALQWLQAEDGSDQYERTQDVLAVPPIFSLESGEIQLVRVGMLAAQPADTEATYRLLFSEIPPPIDNAGGGILRMRIRISMPVFVAPTTVANPALQLVSSAVEDKGLRATFYNIGNTHVRVDELTAVGNDGQAIQRREQAFYVLPGAKRDLFFDSAGGESIVRLIAVTDTAGTREYEVVTP